MNFKHLFLVILTGFSFQLSAQRWIQTLEDGGSYLQVKKTFEVEWQNKPYQRSSGYKPFKRFEHFFEQRLYPDYKWPNPMAVWEEMETAKKDKSANKSASTSTWTPIGPTSWTDGAGWNAGLGRINVVMVDPNNPNTIYVGAPAGGLWKSTNGGNTWNCLTDNQAVLGVSDMQIDPNNSNIIYLATGDGDASNTYSVGVIKSTDGGNTWATTGLNFQVTQTRRIRRLIMHPSNSNILLAATTNGLYKTTNGGTSWTVVSSQSLQDLAFKPNNPSVIYAVNDKFFKSTNTGNSFTEISSGLPPDNQVNRYKIGVSADQPNWVYLVCGKQSDSTFKGMYRSTNSGTNFSLQANSPNIFGYSPTGSDSSGQSWYDLAIVVDPNDASTMWVGGVNNWKSTDGGVTYTIQTNWTYPNSIGYTHADIHYLNIYNGDLYCGSDGGVFVSTDGGDNWTDKSAGLQISQFYRLSTSQTNPNLIIGGTQDNGTNLYTGSNNWKHVVGADGMECIINPTNSSIMYAAIQFGSIRKSTNGGNNFSMIINPDQVNDTGGWVTPYVLDPNNSSHIYVGYTELYKSTNSGNSFTQISNLNSSATLRIVEVCKANSSVIYLGRGQNILRSINGGISFSSITGNLPNKTITSIITDPLDEDRVWVSFSGYTNNQKVYFTSNGGSSWSNLSTGLPNLPANCLLYRDGSVDEIYCGTDVGVYSLTGNSGSWASFGTGLPNVIVDELEITYMVDKLRIATHGRGMWEADLPDNCATDIAAPVISCPLNIPSFYSVGASSCSVNVSLPVATATDDCTSNPDLLWRFIETDIAGNPLPGAVYSAYTSSSSFNFDVGYYEIDWQAEDEAGNSSNCDYQIEIRDEIAPLPSCINNTVQLGASGSVAIIQTDVSSGPIDNCAIDQVFINPDALSCSDLGPNDVNFLVLDENGNTANCNAVLVVVDLLSPSAACIPSFVVGLSNGSAQISSAQIDAGSTDNCSVSSMILDQTIFDCDDLGSNVVTLTVFDSSGNQAQCFSQVIVESFSPVVANCQDIDVVLNGSGIVDVDPAQIDNGSTFDCGNLSFSLDVSSFECLNVGPNDVVLTVDNGLGESDDCTAVIQVEDLIPPVLLCNTSVQINLDANGTASLVASDLDNGSFDNCDFDFFVANTSFNCSDLGLNPVVLSGTDVAGNTGACSSMVSVVDNIPPNAVCNASVSINLDTDGSYILDPLEIDNGSSDNCSGISLFLSNDSFNCDDIGSQSITLSVIDGSGNTQACVTDLIILDGSIPSMVCTDIAVSLDAMGEVEITPSDVDGGSSVSCGNLDLSLSLSTFDCTMAGINSILLTGISDSGNSTTCNANVTVVDSDQPLVTCLSNVSIELDQSGLAILQTTEILNEAIDNCSGALSFAISPSIFSCDNLGLNSVALTATDASGNIGSCSVDVLIEDLIAPTVVCTNSEVTIGLDGSVDIPVISLITSLSDNCDVNPSVSPSQLTFECSDAGINSVSILVSDGNGNTSNCNVDILVDYDDTPAAVCVKQATVALDESGVGVVELEAIDAGSFVLCETPEFILSQEVFSCDHLGFNTVELSVLNNSGIGNSCTTEVLVIDDIAPVIECADLTMELEFDGSLLVYTDQLLLEATDNCEELEFAIESYSFDCSNLGIIDVLVELEDGSGNTASCSSVVTIIDVHPPIAICNDIDLELDVNGQAVLDVNAVGSASFDLCTSVSLDLSTNQFDCSSVGETEVVTLTVSDEYGNITSCQAEVTVLDLLAPDLECQSTEVFIGSDNSGTLDPSSLLGNYEENCALLDLEVSQAIFDCDDLGVQAVTLYVSDESNNMDSCTVSINILDDSNPQASCYPNVELALDETGNLELALSDVYSGDGISCAGFDYQIEPSLFDCTNLDDAVVVTLTIGDPQGLNTVCTSLIAVVDQTAPVALCNDLDTALVDNIDLTLLPELFGEGSYDVCSSVEYIGFDTLIIDCNYLGQTSVELMVQDASGNISTCAASLTVTNEMAPLANCKDAIIYLDDSGNGELLIEDINNNSTDACGDSTLVDFELEFSSVDCSALGGGLQQVELLVTDQGSGISAACTGSLTVVDQVAPAILSIDELVSFSIQGSEPEQLFNTAFNGIVADNCLLTETLIKRESGDCEDSNTFDSFVYFCPEDLEGLHPLTFRVYDESSNYTDTLVYVDLDNLMVSTAETEESLEKVYSSPNPFMDETSLFFNLDKADWIDINIYALDGRLVSSQQRYMLEGEGSMDINIDGAASGLYYCSVSSSSWRVALKLVKVQ